MTILELLKSKGYAPGDYFNVCRTCGKEFVGDKRAITCAGCASEQVGTVAEPNAHSVLAEVRAKLDKRVFYIEKDIEYHNECLLYEDVIKILSEHLR